jgi:hypothetical protein
MNNDTRILKINQLLSASRAGQIGFTETELLRIQKNYVAAKKLDGRRMKMIPAIILAVGLSLLGLSSLFAPSANQTQLHFDEYNQKTASGTNTRADDIRWEAESKMLAASQDESRPTSMMFAFGVITCFVTPLVFFQLFLFKAKSAKEMKRIDDFASELQATSDSRSA